jgi:hypothetical protein
MMGRMALGQEFVGELLSPLASYDLTVLCILSSVIEDWKAGLLGETAVLEMHSLAPAREYKGN